jgi:hypothetical protein
VRIIPSCDVNLKANWRQKTPGYDTPFPVLSCFSPF